MVLSMAFFHRTMILSSFLKISQTDETTANALLLKLAEICEKFNVTFVISISVPVSAIDEKLKDNIIAEL